MEAMRRARPANGTRLEARLNDPVVGPINIRAALHEVSSSESLVVIVHGIGGTADSPYCVTAALAAVAVGCSAVRISLRGADGNGDDIYHAGLTEDLKILLSLPRLDRYRRVFLLGYSLGGTIALMAAVDQIDKRLAGVVAICPPLDLRAAMENFDRRRLWLHKKLLNTHANRAYAVVERRGRACTSIRELRRARNCAEWNQMTIVPRFRFRDANHYYEEASVTRHWRRLRVPALIAASLRDPIVPCESIRRKVAGAPAHVRIAWLDAGGHIHFPRNVDLGEAAALGLENQCVAWLIRQSTFRCSTAHGDTRTTTSRS
jgi:predicted alpha/beta-fold hydrolase